MKKESKLSYDGRNLMTRIPKAIEEESGLKKGDKLEWEADGKELKINKKKEDEITK